MLRLLLLLRCMFLLRMVSDVVADSAASVSASADYGSSSVACDTDVSLSVDAPSLLLLRTLHGLVCLCRVCIRCSWYNLSSVCFFLRLGVLCCVKMCVRLLAVLRPS